MAQQQPPTTFRRLGRILGLGVAATLMLTGCALFDSGSEPNGDGDGAASGGEITIQAVNFPILDPQVVTNGMWFAQQGLLEGLVLQNEEGTDVVPGVADEWEVSEDLKTYTFHIRDGAQWSNGDPVTAEDFVWTYTRLLTPQQAGTGVTLGANSYQTGLGIVGAADYFGGETTDFSEVGITAVADNELEITLDNPNPGFLMGLTHPSMLPLHPATVEEFPEDWQQPENWVGNGAFVLTDWVVNSRMRVEPNPNYWDNENVFLDAVTVQLIEGDATTVAYRNGEVDIMPLGPADVTEFQNDPTLQEHLGSVPSTTVAYLALMRSQNPALQDPRVREALSIGLDRETLAKVSPGSHPGPSLVTDSVPGYDESLNVVFDPDSAKELLAEAGYPNGEGLPEIKVLSGSQVPLIDAIVDQWEEDLGITVSADVVEVGVYVEKRAQVHPADYAGFYIGYFSGLPTMPYFAGTLWGPRFTKEFSLPPDVWAQYQSVQDDASLSPTDRSQQLDQILEASASDLSKEYADLVAEATVTADEDERVQLYQEAARTRAETHLFLPVVWQDSIFAVRPSLQGVNLRATLDGYYLKGIQVMDEGS